MLNGTIIAVSGRLLLQGELGGRGGCSAIPNWKWKEPGRPIPTLLPAAPGASQACGCSKGPLSSTHRPALTPDTRSFLLLRSALMSLHALRSVPSPTAPAPSQALLRLSQHSRWGSGKGAGCWRREGWQGDGR